MVKNRIIIMKKILYILSILFLSFSQQLISQEIYVDPENGDDHNTATKDFPLQTIKKAVARANSLTGTGTISIKLFPGIYTLEDRIDINPVRVMTDTTRFVIEAVHLPNALDWTQEKMPKIQSVSGNNSETIFPHSLGFLVASPHVTFRGLKFLGNGNPATPYYYPIAKEDKDLGDLEVVQCYFIGNKEGAAIQAGVYLHGPNTTVSHCIFHECRNGILLFNNVDGFTVRNTIITKSYESAFWLGPDDMPFTFTNNVIVHNNNFIVGRSADLRYSSPLQNSIIADNDGYVGYWSRENQHIVPISKPNINDSAVKRKGKVAIVENKTVVLPKKHLHLTDDSNSKKLRAGIFMED